MSTMTRQEYVALIEQEALDLKDRREQSGKPLLLMPWGRYPTKETRHTRDIKEMSYAHQNMYLIAPTDAMPRHEQDLCLTQVSIAVGCEDGELYWQNDEARECWWPLEAHLAVLIDPNQWQDAERRALDVLGQILTALRQAP